MQLLRDHLLIFILVKGFPECIRGIMEASWVLLLHFVTCSSSSSLCIPCHTIICHLIQLFVILSSPLPFYCYFFEFLPACQCVLATETTRPEQSALDAASPGFYRMEVLLHCSGLWCLCLNWPLLLPFGIHLSYQLLFPGSKKWLDTLLLDFPISLKGCFCGDNLSFHHSSRFSELNLNLFPLHISKLLLSPVISLPTQTFTLPLSLRFLVGKVLVWK